MKTALLKNPVLRNKIGYEVQSPAGNLIEEINEQEMNSQVGGVTPVITVINTIITQVKGCGWVYTVSAECNGSGSSCN